jgi:hypothetical protein
MKRALVILALLSLFAAPLTARAAPFLVCNPEGIVLATGQTLTYNVSGLPAGFTAAANVPACSDVQYGMCLDMASLSPGSYTITADVCLNDPTQGQVCSANSVPFTFSRVGPPPVPSGMGLTSKQ